jgi:hypothetical protein
MFKFKKIVIKSSKNLARTWQEMSCSRAVMKSYSHTVGFNS